MWNVLWEGFKILISNQKDTKLCNILCSRKVSSKWPRYSDFTSVMWSQTDSFYLLHSSHKMFSLLTYVLLLLYMISNKILSLFKKKRFLHNKSLSTFNIFKFVSYSFFIFYWHLINLWQDISQTINEKKTNNFLV